MIRSRILLAAALLAFGPAAPADTIEVEVNGLVCAFCAQGIDKTLRRFPGTGDVFVSLEDRLVAVALRDGQAIGDAELRRAITDAGYSVVRVRRSGATLAEVRARVRNGRDD
jgi:copper chaperone CopZ